MNGYFFVSVLFCFVSLLFSDEYFSALHCNIRGLTAHFDIIAFSFHGYGTH